MQVGYFLGRPVHRGESARAKPLSYLGRVSEFYRHALEADPCFVGVLSSNPVHGDYSTTYPRSQAYGLPELAAAIPRGWRVPRVATTAEGRNCSLFHALCRRGLKDTDRELEGIAHSLNGSLGLPLPDGEVLGVIRSVLRYRARWLAQGHTRAWLARQAARGRAGGKRSGAIKRAAVRERDLQAVLALSNGLSQREAATALGVSRRKVETARARLARVAHEANTDRQGSRGSGVGS